MSLELGHRLRELRGVSLPQLDRRASLLRRVARKYAIDSDRMLELLERLDRGHEALDIDGRRCFTYRTV